MNELNFYSGYFNECIDVVDGIEYNQISLIIGFISIIKTCNKRLFILGVGGSAANATHAVNDFRKLCNVETYSPSDNVSELTARINDDGWESSYVNWLKVSKLGPNDGILILSVGGGNKENNVSMNLIQAIDYARSVRAFVMGIVGRDGGYTKQNANACVLISVEEKHKEFTTPITEAFQSIIWHLIVSHPDLKENPTKW